LARDDVRTAIYYAFQRHRIEIPWPIQIEYSREWKEPEPHEQADRIERVLSRVDLFAAVPPDFRRELALAADHVVYGTGETIVRQGDPGQSMFVVAAGVVSVVLGPARSEVARIEAGGYFGEMSLLTGEPRTATVLAMGDVEVIELNADLFRRLAEADARAIELIAESAAARQAGLAAARSASVGAVSADTGTLMARMKKFLHFA
jgi:CRP-like cAMP-binding protein